MTVGVPQVELSELYREIILDHFRHPRHKQKVESATAILEAVNPVCGDELELSLRLEGQKIVAIGFTGTGCSINQATSSLMCEAVEGLEKAAAIKMAEQFRMMLLENGSGDELGDLEALQGVSKFPVRIKCALLSWHALLQGLGESVSVDEEMKVMRQ